MTIRRCREDQRRRLRGLFDHRDRRLQGARLDVAALAVVCVEPLREIGGERRVVGREQTRSEIGGPYPPPSIDARTEGEAEMVRVERLTDAGDRRQRRETGIGVAPCDLYPLSNK